MKRNKQKAQVKTSEESYIEVESIAENGILTLKFSEPFIELDDL